MSICFASAGDHGKGLSVFRHIRGMVTVFSFAVYNRPEVIARNSLRRTKFMAKAAMPVDNSIISAAFALHIFPAAYPAVCYCGFNYYIVMAKAAPPAIGDRLPLIVRFYSAAA